MGGGFGGQTWNKSNNLRFFVGLGSDRGEFWWNERSPFPASQRPASGPFHAGLDSRYPPRSWAGEAGSRSLWMGGLKRGGMRKVAGRLAKKMKKNLFAK